MEKIKIRSLGPIKEADINFGDLTFFVGPQASGKSILLQLLKLIIDKTSIENKLENYGFVWGSNIDNNLERFFGEGMAGVWDKSTKVELDGNLLSKRLLLARKKTNVISLAREKIFYVPAQRVLTLNYGWPRNFTEYENSVPYVLRDFSETLRIYLDLGFIQDKSSIFPKKWTSHNYLAYSFNENIFHGGEITVDHQTKKRLKLNIDNLSLPFMTWSTGQKEFMPLLLAFNWLNQTRSLKRKGVEYVIIEEPEMGLYPEAIKSVILQIMDLVARGYRVIVSTHSPMLLEFAWAFNILKNENAPSTSFDALFDIHENEEFSSFFNRKNDTVTVKDISTLDAGSEDLAVSEWGGLSSFASKANDIISSIAAK